MRRSPRLSLPARDVEILRRWADSAGRASVARRARIVLLAAEGLGPSAIAERLGCSKQTAITWRERYRTGGIGGLRDAPRSGRPSTVDEAAVVARTLHDPPQRAARWSTRLLAAEMGISNVAVANVWRTWGIRPGAAGRVRFDIEPVLEAPLEAVRGLLVDPPVRVLALVVGDPGETPTAEPVLDRPDVLSRLVALEGPGGDDHECPPCRTSAREAFLAGLSPHPPGRLCVVVDGPAGTAVDEAVRDRSGEPLRSWLAARPEVDLHRVPVQGSWPRLVQVACSLVATTPAGAGGVEGLIRALDAHKASGTPFAWTA